MMKIGPPFCFMYSKQTYLLTAPVFWSSGMMSCYTTSYTASTCIYGFYYLRAAYQKLFTKLFFVKLIVAYLNDLCSFFIAIYSFSIFCSYYYSCLLSDANIFWNYSQSFTYFSGPLASTLPFFIIIILSALYKYLTA